MAALWSWESGGSRLSLIRIRPGSCGLRTECFKEALQLETGVIWNDPTSVPHLTNCLRKGCVQAQVPLPGSPARCVKDSTAEEPCVRRWRTGSRPESP